MKKTSLIILATPVVMTGAMCQNLVMNYSFEQLSSCPVGLAQIDKAPGWVNGPASNSSDLYNVCSTSAWNDVPANNQGNATPHSGDGYAGSIHYYEACCNCHVRETIEGRLTQPLVSGQTYDVEWWVVRGNAVAVDRFGMILSTYQLTTVYPSTMSCGGITDAVYSTMPAPQVQWPTANGRITGSASWTRVSGTYLASGGEQWIAIGNFYNNTATSVSNGSNAGHYFIDDVCVTLSGGNCAVSALPVELVFFKAVRNEEGRAVLEWQTASETNIDHFTVLKSSDGTHFDPAGNVPATGGRIQPAAYRLVDERPAYGTVYYRLQQTDHNGKVSWSGSTALDAGSPAQFSVAGAACEAAGSIRVSVALPDAGPLSVQLINSVGLVVHSENLQRLPAGLQQVYLAPRSLPAGIYYVRAALPDGRAASSGLIRTSNY